MPYPAQNIFYRKKKNRNILSAKHTGIATKPTDYIEMVQAIYNYIILNFGPNKIGAVVAAAAMEQVGNIEYMKLGCTFWLDQNFNGYCVCESGFST